MKKASILLLQGCLIISACKKKDHNQTNIKPYIPNDQHISVTTQHNNNLRTGWNNQERKLTIANVNPRQFGKLFTLDVDDQVFAQPLIAGNIMLDNIAHNLAYIATVNNSIYSFDADNGNLIWHKNFTSSGMRPPRNTDINGCGGVYQDFSGNMGIVGTPVIDTVSQTLYFVARSTNGTNFIQHLHAVNILTGAERNNSPVQIDASYTGSGDGSINNSISFNGHTQNQRQGLTLVNGVVYISWASHCDIIPYHGWIMGYNAQNLQQQIVYNDTPDGSNGGIWECGMGLAADNAGNLYAAIGNGTVGVGNDPSNIRNRGQSAVKLTPSGSSLIITSFFTPADYQSQNSQDLDFGSIGSLLIPNSNYYFTGSKDATLYLLNKDNMGGFNASSNLIQQSLSLNNVDANEHCQAAYYKGPVNEFVYVWSENDHLKAFPFNRSTNQFNVSGTIVSPVSGPTGQSGAVLSVSSDNSNSGTGVIWAVYAAAGDAEHNVTPGILRAFDADDITHEIWNSNINVQDDGNYNYAKFASPTIANGHVYLSTFSGKVIVYGIK